MDAASGRSIGRLAIAIGMVGLFNVLTIMLMYTVSGFFGPLNDFGNGVAGILIAVLAWRIYPFFREPSQHLRLFALIAAIVGAGVVVLGSVLVIFGVTGWVLAGLVTILGYAVIGFWVVAINYFAQGSNTWPLGLARFGLVIGMIMMIGLFAGPGIIRQVDSLVAAAWSVRLAYASGLGWFLLLPVWSTWLGRRLLSEGLVPRGA